MGATTESKSMNTSQIEQNVKEIFKSFQLSDFIYELLTAYGLPKASISRLKNGNLNLAKSEGEVIWKKKLRYKLVKDLDLHLAITELAKNSKHEERFIIVTDGVLLLAMDTKTGEKLDIDLKELPKHFDFFLPWAGMEKVQHQNENPADVKASERMAKLFDQIKKDNDSDDEAFIHGLNVFLSRLLFCFFAEDTGIFTDSQFTNGIASHTQTDGSDLSHYLDQLFEVLNTDQPNRADLPAYLEAFPYVNGGLFRQRQPAPQFSRKSRQLIIDIGDLDWKDINPDIFGSMFQAVIDPEKRGNLGAHYTSVPNIMKVIEPLFLDELKAEYQKVKGNLQKVNEFLHRLRSIKIFDPACGSGNFLIIAYKELRKLEMQAFREHGLMALSGIELSQFYGIELDDFAHEIAQLSLWLAEHQMNVAFFNEFGRTNPTLPLKKAGKIVCGNACRLNWEEVCPKEEGDEVYILGNPPYLGARVQEASHKEDMDFALAKFKKYRDLDYIAIWFYKGARYLQNSNTKCAFVSTNSICQGLQVGLLWPYIFELGVEIYFAHTSFKWTNSAKSNAGVTVAIIGLANESKDEKTIFSRNIIKKVKGINAYLSDGGKTIVSRRSKPLSDFKPMNFGNMPNDGGGLILSEEEKDQLVQAHPDAQKFIRQLLGAQEYIRGQKRYCLWISDDEKEEACQFSEIVKRIDITKQHRLASKDKGTNKLAERSHQFRDTKEPQSSQIIMPSVSSERREYIPSGFLEKDKIVSNSAQVIFDAEPWLLGVLASKIHVVWLKTVGGRLKTDYRYAKDMVYNTFPFPPISTQRKNELTQCVFRILEEREKHPEKTLAQLYDPDKMPEGLREAHRLNDLAIERCYRSKPFESDEERLEYLFKLYEKMIAEEQAKGGLFEKPKRKRK